MGAHTSELKNRKKTVRLGQAHCRAKPNPILLKLLFYYSWGVRVWQPWTTIHRTMAKLLMYTRAIFLSCLLLVLLSKMGKRRSAGALWRVIMQPCKSIFSCKCNIFLQMQHFLANATFSCKCKIFLPLNVKVQGNINF